MDFIEAAVNQIQFNDTVLFTHAILNPPYRKINSGSSHRLLLRAAGIETVNLYTAFVGLALALMAPGGQLVAIIPRSFCNGLYYRPFREFVLGRAALTHLQRAVMKRYLGEIAWETEVWVAEVPTHLIHFDGERFLGPYEPSKKRRHAAGIKPSRRKW